MTIRGAACIAGAYEHPLRKAPDTSLADLHAQVAAGALADAGLVSPVVAYLASEACTDTGNIIWSVAGRVARVFYAETRGVQFDPAAPLDPDDIEVAWSQITDVEGATPAAPGPIGDAVERLTALGLIG